MSALLQSTPKDPSTGQILAVDGTAAPGYVLNGVPYDSGEVAVDTSGTVDHYHQGLPFTANGRLVITEDIVAYFGSGAAPFADGKLCATEDAVDHYSSGVPYSAASGLSMSGASYNVYYFDTGQYAVLNGTGWTPRGLPFEISFTSDSETYEALGGDQFLATNPRTGWFPNFGDGSGNLSVYESTAGPSHNTGLTTESSAKRQWVARFTNGDGGLDSSLTVNSVTGTNTEQFIPKTVGSNPWTYIGGNGTDKFSGVIKNVSFLEKGVIQGGQEYIYGDQLCNGTLDNQIVLGAGAINIKWDMVREDNPAGASNTIFGVASSATPRLQLSDTGGLTLVLSGDNIVFSGFLADVAQGQHIRIEMRRQAGQDAWEARLDEGDWVAGTGVTLQTATIEIDQIGQQASSPTTRFTNALANLEITGTQPTTETGFFDPDAAVKGSDNCVDKFGGFNASDMGDTELVVVLGTTSTLVSDGGTFDATKGFDPGPTGSQGWLSTYLTGGNAITSGFTLYMEVEKEIFANDFITSGGAFGSLMFSGGNDGGRNFTYFNAGSYWDSNSIGIPIKTSNVALPDFVGVYMTYIPADGHYIYVNRVLVQYYPDDISGLLPTSVTPMGLTDLFQLNLYAFRRNLVLWNKPMPITSNTNVYYLGDSFAQWGAYQSAQIDNVGGGADPNNTPPSSMTGVYSGVNPSFDTRYELKNESTMANFHRTFSEKGYHPTCLFLGQGASTVSNDWVNPVITSPTLLSDQVTTALTGVGLPTGGAADTCNIWIIQSGTNDINFAFNDTLVGGDGNPDRPFSDLDVVVDGIKAQIDIIKADGATHQVIVVNIAQRYEQNQENVSQWPAQTAYLNALYASELEGYAGITRVADVNTGWNFEFTKGLDPGNDNHPGPTGQAFIAEKVAEVLPSLTLSGEQTYTFPLSKVTDDTALIENTGTSGEAYKGKWSAENWVYIETNNRLYRINEGTGLALENDLKDATDVGTTTDATLTSIAGWNAVP